MIEAEFDKFAERYDQEHQRSIAFSGCEAAYFARYKVEIAADYFRALCEGKEALLDFGCGPGTSLPLFRKALPQSRIVAADVSRRSLAEAEARCAGQAEYLWIAGSGLDLETEEIGMAFAACVFHHIPPTEHESWMTELRRVVRPGGGLVVFEHNPLNPLTHYAVSRCVFDKDAILLRARTLADRLTSSGWHVRRIRFHVFFPQWLHWLRPLEPALGRIPLGGQYSVFAIKT
jgi:ubiquinone/menaquinone biosynthesis C-methylase UbiE